VIAPVPQIELLGMPLARLTPSEVLDHVFAALSQGQGGWIITANLDYLQRHVSDAAAAALYARADLIVADGIPLIWASRLQGTPLPSRVAGSDLVWLMAERAARSGRTLYLLGGNPGSAEGAARRFVSRWPGLRIGGISSPRVSAEPSEDELASIRASLAEARPDLVYVALGAPKEERVITALRGDFPETWWMGVGISLSFVAGDITRAPGWIQRAGLEWLHRLIQEPRRLSRRYLLDNLPFTLRLLARAWRTRP
jgi:N-acetylglucosaminyldiphosphoundecaprenol N-acetyl-beta-D-mannosaminyltransferase